MEETIELVAPIHRRPRNLESVQYLARERRLARQQRALRRVEARQAKEAKATIAAAHKAVAEIVAQQDGMPGSENWTENEWQAWADSLKAASSGIMSWQNWTNEILYGTGSQPPGLMNALVKPHSVTVTSALATGETASITGIYDPPEPAYGVSPFASMGALPINSPTATQHLKLTSTYNNDGTCSVSYEVV